MELIDTQLVRFFRCRNEGSIKRAATRSQRWIFLVSLMLLIPGCRAWTWTPEERASHEAYETGYAACDKLKDEFERMGCFNDLPEDLTQIDPDEVVGVPLTGIDHLADHLSVQNFYVDGTPGAQAGKGGSLHCCVGLPRVWRPGLTVEVRWNVTNWRDCTGEDFVRRVPVERYDPLSQIWVHFLANGSVRVVSSNYYPEGARNPESEYPVKEPIPDKHPWSTYSLDVTCKNRDNDRYKEQDRS